MEKALVEAAGKFRAKTFLSPNPGLVGRAIQTRQ
jgi:hypothetical protein